jgi:hypothetical protein
MLRSNKVYILKDYFHPSMSALLGFFVNRCP